MADLDLLQGTLDVLILKTLTWGPRHGYGIAHWLRQTSDEAIVVEDKALYVALHRLQARELVESEWKITEKKRRARYYRLTPAGRAHLRAESERLVDHFDALTTVLAAKKV